METLSINTCRLHGSPKMSSSKQASPHHHPRLSRVQTLDLMDDIPLPFHTGKHTINFMWCNFYEHYESVKGVYFINNVYNMHDYW